MTHLSSKADLKMSTISLKQFKMPLPCKVMLSVLMSNASFICQHTLVKGHLAPGSLEFASALCTSCKISTPSSQFSRTISAIQTLSTLPFVESRP